MCLAWQQRGSFMHARAACGAAHHRYTFHQRSCRYIDRAGPAVPQAPTAAGGRDLCSCSAAVVCHFCGLFARATAVVPLPVVHCCPCHHMLNLHPCSSEILGHTCAALPHSLMHVCLASACSFRLPLAVASCGIAGGHPSVDGTLQPQRAAPPAATLIGRSRRSFCCLLWRPSCPATP